MITAQTIVLDALRNHFHLNEFRAPQQEIISALLEQHDVLALLPTGAGKSLCYQLPATILPGTTIVVSPLLSLINDQVAKLKKLGVSAAALTSQKSFRQQARIRTALKKRKLKLLYLSPEKLLSKSWTEILASLPVSMVVVDEAHCVAMWGTDFRPAYIQIKNYCDKLRHRPIIAAFTATATKESAQYISQMLGLIKPKQFRLSTRKPHLQILVQPCYRPVDKLITLISYLEKPDRLPAIIYCSTRAAVMGLKQLLQKLLLPFLPKITIAAYHGGLKTKQRITIEQQFITNRTDILIATNAFGMGVDKPNIRTVIHWQIPASIENFYQEIGRAGRDLKPAVSILCYLATDVTIQEKLNKKHTTAQIRDQQKLTKLVRLARSNRCINQQLEHYFGDSEHLAPCGQCSNCVSTQPLTSQCFQLARQLTRSINAINSKIPTPICMIELLSVLQPTTYTQLLCIPGVGRGWLKKYAAITIVLSKVFQLAQLLTENKNSTILAVVHEQTAEPS